MWGRARRRSKEGPLILCLLRLLLLLLLRLLLLLLLRKATARDARGS